MPEIIFVLVRVQMALKAAVRWSLQGPQRGTFAKWPEGHSARSPKGHSARSLEGRFAKCPDPQKLGSVWVSRAGSHRVSLDMCNYRILATRWRPVLFGMTGS